MKKMFLLVALCFSITGLRSQIELKWSQQFVYDNKLDGFFDYYIGTNSSYIYAKFSNLTTRPKKRDKKVKLIAFDKNTMSKVGEAQLVGYDKSAEKEDMEYYKSIILDHMIHVLWLKKKKGAIEVYAESFDNKMKRVNTLKKVYEVNRGKNGVDHLLVLYNKDIDNKILILKEFAITKGDQNLKIEYKVVNEDLTVANSNQVTLPIVIVNRSRGGDHTDNIAGYEFGGDGKLYIQDKVRLSEEERKNLKKGEANVYTHMMQVDLESGRVHEYRLKFPKKNTFNVSSIITKNGVKLYGFFCDLDKDPKGNDSHGIFYISLDNSSFSEKNKKFSYFEKSFLDKLFEADKENQKKGKGLFKSKQAKQSDDESLDDNYVIEQTIADGNDILLFCSIMKNWSRTVCTTDSKGNRSCTTYYYCTKNNVTAFRLNAAGDILWASNLDRSITYNRWNVWDLQVVKKDNTYYATYGSAFQPNAKKKNMRSSKSGKQLTDRLEYAMFDGATGDYKKSEYQINGFNTKKSDSKYVSADDIEVYDGKFYTSCVKSKLKGTTYIACLCPPVFYFMMNSGNSRKGTGFLGTISPLK